MHYMITGGEGQLGKELTLLLKEKNVDFSSLNSEELDILDKNSLRNTINDKNPDVIFHCAAYTAVDKAEDEKEKNWAVNVEGTRNVVRLCKGKNILFVFISTDYVFNGESDIPYKIDDKTTPINEYGRVKQEAEEIVEGLLENYYIIRTSWVFGEHGSNFVYTMKKLAQRKSELTIVGDQFGRPTWTRTLSEFMWYIVSEKLDYGIYHLANDGSCSWYEFAEEILKTEDVDVTPITSEEFPQKAKRPKNSILDLSGTKESGFKIKDWKEALHKFLNEIESTN